MMAELTNLKNLLAVLTPQLDSLKDRTQKNITQVNENNKKVADLEAALAASIGPVCTPCSLPLQLRDAKDRLATLKERNRLLVAEMVGLKSNLDFLRANVSPAIIK